MKIHELKTVAPYFHEVWAGDKTFELRRNDRGFEVGDFLILKHWKTDDSEYSGMWILAKITSVLEGFDGIHKGFCVQSIEVLDKGYA